MAVNQSLKLYQSGQDLAGNSSKLRILWQSTQTNDSHNNNSRTAYYYVSVNDGAETKYSVTYTLPKNSTKTIVDVTINVKHDDEGKCSVKVRTWMDTKISAGEVTKSASITLTPIPRANSVMAQDTYIGDPLRIIVSRKSTSYQHSIKLAFGSLSGFLSAAGAFSTTETKSTATEYAFSVPDSWDAQIPNAKEGTCTITCITYSGSTEIGRSSTTVKIKTDSTFAPSITANVVDINSSAIALTGNNIRLIRGISTARATMTATAKRSATLKSTFINGVASDAVEIVGVQSGAFVFSATDSRGWTAEKTVNLEIVPYIALTAVAVAQRAAQGADAISINVSGNYFNGSFGATSNTLSVSVSANSGSWKSVTPKVSGNTYSAAVELSLDYQSTHTVSVRVTDKCGSVTKSLKVPKAVPITIECEDFIRHNVPVYQVLPRYASDSDSDESQLENWLEGLLDDMPNMSSMDIAWNCYPAVTGTTVFAKLSRYTSANHAVVHGASYDGKVYLKSKMNTWGATKKVVIG